MRKINSPSLFTSRLAAPDGEREGEGEREREGMGEEWRVTLDSGGFVGTYQRLMAKHWTQRGETVNRKRWSACVCVYLCVSVCVLDWRYGRD